MLSRRALLIHGSLATFAAACGSASLPEPEDKRRLPSARPMPDEVLADVLGRALDEAKSLGATYADARVHRRRHERLAAREDHLVDVSSRDSYGVGVRVLVAGAWGFASSPTVSEDSAREAARRAVAVARASAGTRVRPIALAPVSQYTDVYRTPMQIDPFEVSLAEKAELLLSFWPEAKKVTGATVTTLTTK